jgi:hypothetical protein
MLAVVNVVVDNVNIEFGDVFDISASGDDQFAQVEKTEVNLGLIVFWYMSTDGISRLPRNVKDLSARDSRWSIIKTGGVSQVNCLDRLGHCDERRIRIFMNM